MQKNLTKLFTEAVSRDDFSHPAFYVVRHLSGFKGSGLKNSGSAGTNPQEIIFICVVELLLYDFCANLFTTRTSIKRVFLISINQLISVKVIYFLYTSLSIIIGYGTNF